MKPKKNKVQLLLEILKDGQTHFNYELATKVGLRYGDAIFKARNLGYEIKTEQLGTQYMYRWNRH